MDGGDPSAVILVAPRALWGGGIEGKRSLVVRGYDKLTSGDVCNGLLLTEEVRSPPPPL